MKLYPVILFLVLSGCGSADTDDGRADFEDRVSQEKHDGYPDDTYCATVEYRNPNTGTESSYTLTVGVQDNQITELNWPNGGTLDQDHFDAADIDEDGHAEFTSDKGYEYSIEITGESSNCLANAVMVKQCNGLTKNGIRCRHMTDNENQLCWQNQK